MTCHFLASLLLFQPAPSNHDVRAHVQALGSEDVDRRIRAAESLSRIGESAVPELRKALLSKSIHSQLSATYALSRIKSTSALPEIGVAIRSDHSLVRVASARAMSAIGDPSSIPVMLKALEGETNYFVRTEILKSLRSFGGGAERCIPVVVKLAFSDMTRLPTDRSWRNSREYRQLCQGGDYGIIDSFEFEKLALPSTAGLIAFIESDFRVAAATFLAQLGTDEAGKALSALLRSDQEDIRSSTVLGLRNSGIDAKVALPSVRRALGDSSPFVRKSAAEVLGNLGSDAMGSLADLERATRDEDADVREAARVAIKKIMKN